MIVHSNNNRNCVTRCRRGEGGVGDERVERGERGTPAGDERAFDDCRPMGTSAFRPIVGPSTPDFVLGVVARTSGLRRALSGSSIRRHSTDSAALTLLVLRGPCSGTFRPRCPYRVAPLGPFSFGLCSPFAEAARRVAFFSRRSQPRLFGAISSSRCTIRHGDGPASEPSKDYVEIKRLLSREERDVSDPGRASLLKLASRVNFLNRGRTLELPKNI